AARLVRICDGVTTWTTPLGAAVLLVADAGPGAKPILVTGWKAMAPAFASVSSISVAGLIVHGAASTEIRIPPAPPTVIRPPRATPLIFVPGIRSLLPCCPRCVSWFVVAVATWKRAPLVVGWVSSSGRKLLQTVVNRQIFATPPTGSTFCVSGNLVFGLG